MELREASTLEQVTKIIETDPVRRHIVSALRLKNGARVFYYGTPEDCKAAVCIHTSRIIPDSEEQLLTEYHYGGANLNGTKAIFYTVWATKKGFGLGRQVLNASLSQLIIENNHDRYITLSPKGDLVRKFHEKNGAKLIRESLWANNFEYEIRHGRHTND
jgi:hypothetical protein